MTPSKPTAPATPPAEPDLRPVPKADCSVEQLIQRAYL